MLGLLKESMYTSRSILDHPPTFSLQSPPTFSLYSLQRVSLSLVRHFHRISHGRQASSPIVSPMCLVRSLPLSGHLSLCLSLCPTLSLSPSSFWNLGFLKFGVSNSELGVTVLQWWWQFVVDLVVVGWLQSSPKLLLMLPTINLNIWYSWLLYPERNVSIFGRVGYPILFSAFPVSFPTERT